MKTFTELVGSTAYHLFPYMQSQYRPLPEMRKDTRSVRYTLLIMFAVQSRCSFSEILEYTKRYLPCISQDRTRPRRRAILPAKCRAPVNPSMPILLMR